MPRFGATDVSLVVIARNEALRLPVCIASLARFKEFPKEIVFVDNGSTDQTVEIMRHAADILPTKIVVVQESQPGIPQARNAGLRVAAGQIVAFVDADCEVSANFLTVILDCFNTFDVAAIAGRYEIVGPDQRIASYRERGWANAFGWTRPGREVLTAPQGHVGMLIGGCSAIRRDVLDAVGGFDNQLQFSDDIGLSLRIYSHGYHVLRDPALYAKHHIDTHTGTLLKKDWRYASDEALLWHKYLGRRFSFDAQSYVEIARSLKAFVTGGDRYHLFEVRRRCVLKLSITMSGLARGAVFL